MYHALNDKQDNVYNESYDEKIMIPYQKRTHQSPAHDDHSAEIDVEFIIIPLFKKIDQ
jgi:hypothetical protein